MNVTMQTEQEAYEHWRDTFWKFGSSTDEARARRAWDKCRAAVFVPGDGMLAMEVDPERWADEQGLWQTGIFVRAKVGEKFESVDIAVLKKESLLAWLRSRGGSNPWAEYTVAMMLGHGAGE